VSNALIDKTTASSAWWTRHWTTSYDDGITKRCGATNFFWRFAGNESAEYFFGPTNRVGSGGPGGTGLAPVAATFGITNQIYASFFTIFVSDSEWTRFSLDPLPAMKLKAIHDFRQFSSLSRPARVHQQPCDPGWRKEAGAFSPTRKMELRNVVAGPTITRPYT